MKKSHEIEKIDLTGQGPQELSLLVFNTEHLYISRWRADFLEELATFYIFTDEQLDELLADIEADREDIWLRSDEGEGCYE